MAQEECHPQGNGQQREQRSPQVKGPKPNLSTGQPVGCGTAVGAGGEACKGGADMAWWALQGQSCRCEVL